MIVRLDHLPISNLCRASLFCILNQYRAADGTSVDLPGHSWVYDGERYYVQHVPEGNLPDGFEGCVFRVDDTRIVDPQVGMIRIDKRGQVKGLPGIGSINMINL